MEEAGTGRAPARARSSTRLDLREAALANRRVGNAAAGRAERKKRAGLARNSARKVTLTNVRSRRPNKTTIKSTSSRNSKYFPDPDILNNFPVRRAGRKRLGGSSRSTSPAKKKARGRSIKTQQKKQRSAIKKAGTRRFAYKVSKLDKMIQHFNGLQRLAASRPKDPSSSASSRSGSRSADDDVEQLRQDMERLTLLPHGKNVAPKTKSPKRYSYRPSRNPPKPESPRSSSRTAQIIQQTSTFPSLISYPYVRGSIRPIIPVRPVRREPFHINNALHFNIYDDPDDPYYDEWVQFQLEQQTEVEEEQAENENEEFEEEENLEKSFMVDPNVGGLIDVALQDSILIQLASQPTIESYYGVEYQDVLELTDTLQLEDTTLPDNNRALRQLASDATHYSMVRSQYDRDQ